jgi:hypothetical protein
MRPVVIAVAIIIEFSTGGRGPDSAARGAALYQKPDMASLATVATPDEARSMLGLHGIAV